jgi:site-specific DNA recombinase
VPRKAGSRPQWEPDPVEAPRVREAIERILDGESRRSVLRWLQSTGYAPASAGALIRSLLSPSLAGKRMHKGNEHRGTWEAIITADQHRRLVAASKALTSTPGPEAKHLAAGIVKCGKCGQGVRHKTVKRVNGRKPLYVCPRGCTSRLPETLDAELKMAILRRLRNLNPADHDTEDPEVAAAVQQIEDLEADLAKWKAKAIAGDVDADVYAAVEKDRKAKMNALRPRTAVPPLLRLRPENWEGATLQEKRDCVRAFLDVKLTGAANGGVDITPK